MADFVFAFVVLLSVLIFVHELGHFLVAKACGVRILKFSLGFGPPIGIGRFRLTWKRGHTEYVVAWIPLGGFVKMLGEHHDEEEDPEVCAHPEETLGAKPLWQKLAIVFAGPVMNLALPVLIFVGMQAVGLPGADAVIGLVEAGSPAEAAGLLPGDRVTALDGEPVRWWREVANALRASPGRELELSYEREGRSASLRLAVEAREGFSEYGEPAEVGWAGLGHSRPSALLGILDPRAAGRAAGLRSGDLVTAVAGRPIEDWYGLRDAYAEAEAGGSVPFEVKRGLGTEPETLRVEVPGLGSLAALGVVRATALISEVEPGSPADRAGLEKEDLILECDGEPVTYFASFARAVSTSQGRAIPLVYARDGELHRIVIAAEPIATDTGFGVEETRYRIGIRGSEALVVGSIATDRERNPFVSFPRAVEMTVDITRVFMVGLGKLITGEVSSRNLAGPIGIAQIAASAFERGWEPYLRIMVLISINLGILNLLPIPVLDGGQATLFLVEGIKRSPLSLRTKLAVQQIGITVLVLLMGLAFWNDLSRLWSKVVDWLPGGM
jgi:regulator of sigma E protease